jgi:hypothetical protein
MRMGSPCRVNSSGRPVRWPGQAWVGRMSATEIAPVEAEQTDHGEQDRARLGACDRQISAELTVPVNMILAGGMKGGARDRRR